jgi:hypothetical protein
MRLNTICGHVTKGKHEVAWNEYLVKMRFRLQYVAQLIYKGINITLLDVILNKLWLSSTSRQLGLVTKEGKTSYIN